ncbi:MAG: hypothetical protein E5V53_20820 [Mesorhizobium sp.]|nr:MAG: hypothetical protein E5V53_20820 [Mesorhizobium sp.]
MSATIPGFSRVEIRTRGKDDLLLAAIELRRLADELQIVAHRTPDEETATILAHHKIKATSQLLRGK